MKSIHNFKPYESYNLAESYFLFGCLEFLIMQNVCDSTQNRETLFHFCDFFLRNSRACAPGGGGGIAGWYFRVDVLVHLLGGKPPRVDGWVGCPPVGLGVEGVGAKCAGGGERTYDATGTMSPFSKRPTRTCRHHDFGGGWRLAPGILPLQGQGGGGRTTREKG